MTNNHNPNEKKPEAPTTAPQVQKIKKTGENKEEEITKGNRETTWYCRYKWRWFLREWSGTGWWSWSQSLIKRVISDGCVVLGNGDFREALSFNEDHPREVFKKY